MKVTERMQTEWELTRLVYHSLHALDHWRNDEFVASFTQDCSFDRLGQVLQGQQAISDAYANRLPFITRHCVANMLFGRVEEAEAEATMYVSDFIGKPATDGLPVRYHLPEPILLTFEDIYRRTEEGWRIHRRRARIVMQPAEMAA